MSNSVKKNAAFVDKKESTSNRNDMIVRPKADLATSSIPINTNKKENPEDIGVSRQVFMKENPLKLKDELKTKEFKQPRQLSNGI
jgi:hypothetical protein